jgi:hypothetical protein
MAASPESDWIGAILRNDAIDPAPLSVEERSTGHKHRAGAMLDELCEGEVEVTLASHCREYGLPPDRPRPPARLLS